MRKSAVFLFCLAVAGLSHFVVAEEGTELCQADVQKFCKDIKPGDARIMHCLKEHHDQLSPACKAKGDEMHKGMMEMKKEMGHDMMEKNHEACKADREKFCKDVKPGGGKIMECMKAHKAELSKDCQAMHEKMKEHMMERTGKMHHQDSKDAAPADAK
jgi:hypothetical protein